MIHTIEIHNCSDLTLSVLVLSTHLLQGHLCFRGRIPGCWGLTPSHSQIYRVLNLTKLYHMLVVPPPCWGILTFFFHCCSFSSSSSSSPLFSNLVLLPSSSSLLLFPSSFCAASFAFADLAHHLQLCMSFMVEGSHSLHIGSHWRFDDKDNSDGPLLTKLEQLILGHKDLGSFSHTPLHNVTVDELSGGLPHT